MSKLTDYTRAHPVGFTMSLIAFVVVALFIYSFYGVIAYSGKVKVTVTVAPFDAAIYVNGDSTNAGTTYLKPGTYTFLASKSGYKDGKKTVVIDDSQKEIDVPISLTPESDDAKKEADKNSAAYLKNEGLAGKQAEADGVAFRDRNTIVSKLPYKTLLYTIGYQSDTSDPSGMSIIVTVEANEGMRADVVAQIARWGYDPTELNIQFRNYRNPFQ